MKWDFVLLKDISEQIRGVSYKPSNVSPVLTENHLPVLRANNITENGIDYNDLVYIDKKRISEKQILKYGDILIAASSGSKHIVGKAVSCKNEIKASFGAFCKVIRPNEDIDFKYIGFYFQSSEYREIISNLSEGANINNIRNENLDNLEIPLPPLPTQKRIAAILDKAGALRRKDQELLRKYDDLAQAIFIDMFGDPVKNEKEWEVKKLGGVCDKITDGTHQSPIFTDSGIPFLFVSNIVNNKINYQTNTFITEDEFKILEKRTPIEIGNILITTVGSYGNPAIIEKETKFCFQRHIAFIKPNHKAINYKYLFGCLKSPFVQQQIDKKVRGVAQKTLNLSELSSLEILYPPMSLQVSYSKIFDNLNIQNDKIIQNRNYSSSLFQSLLQQAFRGELK